jgi:phage FluMu protein Com
MILRQEDRFKEAKCPNCKEKLNIEIFGENSDNIRKKPRVSLLKDNKY